MRLNLGRLQPGEQPAVSEGEPLPPEDRIKSGSGQPQFEKLYRSQKARLFRLFSRRASRDEAQDLVQETFVRFASATQTNVRGFGCAEAYISRIAGNLLRDRAKFAARRSLALHVSVEDVELRGPDQQSALEERDVLRRLEAAMLELKPLTREVFMAHRLDGYTYKEVAARMGLSEKAVEKQMSRAIAHVTRAMIDR